MLSNLCKWGKVNFFSDFSVAIDAINSFHDHTPRKIYAPIQKIKIKIKNNKQNELEVVLFNVINRVINIQTQILAKSDQCTDRNFFWSSVMHDVIGSINSE